MNKLPKTVLVLFSIFCLLISIIYAYPDGWSNDILLTPEDTKSRIKPDLDVDWYKNVWAAWDTATWVNGTAEVLYSKRDSLGSCLIPEKSVSNNPTFSTNPKVAVDGSNNIQFIWRDASPQGEGIWHAKLANDGSEIVPSHLAVSGAGGGSSSMRPDMVINKYNEINIIWDESPAGYNQMNYTKLDSFGDTIIAKIRVSPETIRAYWPGIGVDSMANNHFAYRTDTTTVTNRLTYSKLDKDGNILIDNQVLDLGTSPTIIADRNQNIHMIYAHPTGYGWTIRYLKLAQDGNILINPKTLSIHEHNGQAHMAMDSLQSLHVVWNFDNFNDTIGIMYTKLDTCGNYILSPMPVVYPPAAVSPGYPRIAADLSNRLHLVWQDQRLNPGVSTAIFYKRGENETSVEEVEILKIANRPKISVFPNPFCRETKIIFSLTLLPAFETSQETKKARIEVFDVIGRKVKIFILGKSEGVVMWKGTDDLGNYLPAGVYFLHFTSSIEKQTMPIVLLR